MRQFNPRLIARTPKISPSPMTIRSKPTMSPASPISTRITLTRRPLSKNINKDPITTKMNPKTAELRMRGVGEFSVF
jgi:hypothetical protein